MPKDTDLIDPKTPPRQRKEEGESNTPSTETTKQLPLPCRRQLAKLEWKYYNDLRCMQLRCRIGKIKELEGDMIERYGKYEGVPLPEKVKTKIELLFQHRIERRWAEMHLTIEVEEKWKSKDSNVMESDLSSSGGEEEEHDSNNVNFVTESGEEEDYMEIDRQIAKGEFLVY